MIDAFPHYADSAKRDTMIMLMNKYENGYFLWYALLEKICQTYNDTTDLHLDFKVEEQLEKTAGYLRISSTKLLEFCDSLASMDMIDREHWANRNVWVATLRENLVKMHKYKRLKFPVAPGVFASEVEKPAFKNESLEFAELKLWPYIQMSNPRATPKLKEWAKDIDRMVRIDGRSYEEMAEAIDYATHLLKIADDYPYVIESAVSFRKKFEKIMRRKHSRVRTPGVVINPIADDLRRAR